MTDNQRARKAAEIHKIYVGTFETEIGKKCLELMKDTFINRAIYKAGQSFEETTRRQGEADAIYKIIKEISHGSR